MSLSVPSGTIVGVTGPSGSGKSTLLHVVGAMDVPDSGRIVVGKAEVTAFERRSQAEYRRTIGFVFQRFHLLPALSVLDNVAAPLLPFKTSFDKSERAAELLAAVGLGGREDALPSQLSGGQQQRVAIARALVNDPGLLLADEPTGNLDSTTGTEIMELLLDLRRTRGMTVLVATHTRSSPPAAIGSSGSSTVMSSTTWKSSLAPTPTNYSNASRAWMRSYPFRPKGVRPARARRVSSVAFLLFTCGALLGLGTAQPAIVSSPPGSKIAFTRFPAVGNTSIYTTTPAATNLRPLLARTDANLTEPAWSPDRRHLAFVAMSAANVGGIFVADAAGKGARRLTRVQSSPSNTVLDAHPRWSPDGKRIAFHRYRDTGSTIYVMNANGTGLRSLGSDSSPAGRRTARRSCSRTSHRAIRGTSPS